MIFRICKVDGVASSPCYTPGEWGLRGNLLPTSFMYLIPLKSPWDLITTCFPTYPCINSTLSWQHCLLTYIRKFLNSYEVLRLSYIYERWYSQLLQNFDCLWNHYSQQSFIHCSSVTSFIVSYTHTLDPNCWFPITDIKQFVNLEFWSLKRIYFSTSGSALIFNIAIQWPSNKTWSKFWSAVSYLCTEHQKLRILW